MMEDRFKRCPKCGMRAAGRHTGSAVCKHSALGRRLENRGLVRVCYDHEIPAHERFVSTARAAREALHILGHRAELHPTHETTGRVEAWTTPQGIECLRLINVAKAAVRESIVGLAKNLRRNRDLLNAIDSSYRLTGDLDAVRDILV